MCTSLLMAWQMLAAFAYDTGHYLLEFLRVILVWPAAILVIGFYFLRNHKVAINKAIDRLVKVSGVGAVLDFGGTPPAQADPKPPESLGKGLESDASGKTTTDDPILKRVMDDPKGAADMLRRLAFEYVYNRIFGSQFQFLVHLFTSANQRMTQVEVAAYFDGLDEAIRNYGFDRWLSFLTSLSFIKRLEVEGVVSYQLQSKGADFVAYVRKTWPGAPPFRAY